MTLTKINYVKKCYFCGGNHICRDCPLEAQLAPILKKKVGNCMEYYIGENINCPECNHQSLKVIGNHSPSLDIICKECNKKFEVKSKCLSINKLPNDIKLPHGSYLEFINRLKDDLGLIVIIYGVDRINKTIVIREILYANNSSLNNYEIINIEKRENSSLSNIFIKDKKYLKKLRLINSEVRIDFDSEIQNYKNGYINI